MDLSKKMLLILLPLLIFTSIQGNSQQANSNDYSKTFTAKVGDSRQYELTLLNSTYIDSALRLDNNSEANFNETSGLIFNYTVMNINYTDIVINNTTYSYPKIYVQLSLNVKYRITGSPDFPGYYLTNPPTKLTYGTIKGEPIFVDYSSYYPMYNNFISYPLGPAFTNQTFVSNYLNASTTVENSYSNYTNSLESYSLSGNYYTVTTKLAIYPFTVLESYTANWKTGWLHSQKNQQLSLEMVNSSLEMVNSNLLNSITNSPIDLIGLGGILVIIVAGVILITKYKRYKNSDLNQDTNLSFTNYTKNILKRKNEKQKTRESIDTDKALSKIEDIIEENKEK